MEQTSATGFHTGKKILEPGNIKEYLSKVCFFRCTVRAIWIDEKDKGGNSDKVSRPQVPNYTRISQVCIVKTCKNLGSKSIQPLTNCVKLDK